MARRILVVGGGYAGVLFANRLARKTRAEDAEIVLVNARATFVERVRLHQDVAGDGPVRRSLASIVDRDRVRLHIGTIGGIDLRARRAVLTDKASEGFDELVLATGSVAAMNGVPGIEHSWASATEEEAFRLRDRLRELPTARVVVVGGGLTGIELASELAELKRELRVTLVTRDEVAPMVSPGAQQYIRTALKSLGVEVREQSLVVAIERDGVVLASGDLVPSDVTAWCGGLEPTRLARDIGLDVDTQGRAIVDAHLTSTSHDFVRVIGDAARVEIGDHAQILRMACATANPQAAFCADDLAAELRGRPRKPFSFAYFIQCLSVGRRLGVVQRVDPWDVPGGLELRGRTGGVMKEIINRYAFGSPRLERHGIGYHWPKAPSMPMLATRNP